MLTSQLVRDFWLHMQQHYGSTVVAKNDSAVMAAAAMLLDTLNILDKERFLKDFVTTLGKTIYIPFKLGDDDWSLWDQTKVCVHEHQHVVQGERDGWATFGSRYLSSSSWRAGYEAEAYGCDLELEFWKGGHGFNPYDYALWRVRALKSYGCTEADISQAAAMLGIRAGVVVQGVVENDASKVAIAWLDQHAPDLRIGR